MQRGRVNRSGRARTCALVVLATLVFAPVVAPSTAAQGAGSPSPTDLQQLRNQLAESSSAMVAAGTALRRAQSALPGARQAAVRYRTLLDQARLREEAAAQRTGVAQTEVMLASRSTEETASLVAGQRARIGRLARAVYQHGGSIADISMLLDARSPADFTERLVALQTIVTSQRSALADLQKVTDNYGNQTISLERTRDSLAAAREKAEREVETVAELAARAQAAEQQVRQLVDAQRNALAAAQAARAEDERRLAELRGESTRLQALLAAQVRRAFGPGALVSGAGTPVQGGVLTFPVIGPVTSPFGMRVHPITGVRKLHTGTDFGVPCGTPIKAARSGTVLVAEYNQAYGWRTVLSHGIVGGVLLTTTYNHQMALGVATGDQVLGGQVIGHVGTTGYSTGCHLHFELLVNSDLVDPLPWLLAP
jgi:murein DD-endopeptidase MepM/ murein hydrolase activator NlpD